MQTIGFHTFNSYKRKRRRTVNHGCNLYNKVGIKSSRHFLFFIFLRETRLDKDIQIAISIALRMGYKADVLKYQKADFFIFYKKNRFFPAIKSLRHLLTFQTTFVFFLCKTFSRQPKLIASDSEF